MQMTRNVTTGARLVTLYDFVAIVIWILPLEQQPIQNNYIYEQYLNNKPTIFQFTT
jgi:hypothetical protein